MKRTLVERVANWLYNANERNVPMCVCFHDARRIIAMVRRNDKEATRGR